jgi:HEAT repeat protein
VTITAQGRIGAAARDAVPLIREALQDEDVEVRQQAAEALQKIEPREGAARR